MKSARGDTAILGRGDHTRNMFGTSLHTAYIASHELLHELLRRQTAIAATPPFKHRQVTDLVVTDLGVSGAQDSVLRDRCSVGARHAFFSITFLSIQAVSWGGQSSVTRSGIPGPKNPKTSAMRTTIWHCSALAESTPSPNTQDVLSVTWKRLFSFQLNHTTGPQHGSRLQCMCMPLLIRRGERRKDIRERTNKTQARTK